MLHCIRKGMWFYHIPKTGGRPFLINELNKKATGHAVVSLNGPNKIIVVLLRCPVDRFLSCHYMFSNNINQVRPTHDAPKKLIRNTPLETLNYIIENNINLDKFNPAVDGAHFSGLYRWLKDLDPEYMIYRSFQDFKNNSVQIDILKSVRPDLLEEPNLQEITQKVKIIYSKDYAHLENIPSAAACLQEWL